MKLLNQDPMSIEEYVDKKASFKSGDLWKRWYESHPELFLDHDTNTLNNQARRGHHFHEYLAAVLFLEIKGYLCLIEKYQFGNHPEMNEVIARIDSITLSKAIKIIKKDFYPRYGPDLLVYSPDFTNWFFCEVKGPDDNPNAQQKVDCARLAQVTQKPVRLVKFLKVKDIMEVALLPDIIKYDINELRKWLRELRGDGLII